jgi:hypothetical protein
VLCRVLNDGGKKKVLVNADGIIHVQRFSKICVLNLWFLYSIKILCRICWIAYGMLSQITVFPGP